MMFFLCKLFFPYCQKNVEFVGITTMFLAAVQKVRWLKIHPVWSKIEPVQGQAGDMQNHFFENYVVLQ